MMMFQCLMCFSASLCFPKHDSSLPFVQGLVDRCVSVWRATVVAQSSDVWEIKEPSFSKQHQKQAHEMIRI